MKHGWNRIPSLEHLHLSEFQPHRLIFHIPFHSIDGTNTGMVTIPGEALSNLGTEIRNDLLNMKFDNVLLGGYDTTRLLYLNTQNSLSCVLLEYLYLTSYIIITATLLH